jgi:hypothetical protein
LRRSPAHRVFAADAHRVPAPFRSLAVRSDEACHATAARAPYGRVHRVQTALFDAPTLARLAATGLSRVQVDAFSDIGHAHTTLDELAAASPAGDDVAGRLTDALRQTGVLGPCTAPYRRCLETRIDHLVTCGAGFHNDVMGHWSRCLFWVLVLDAVDVEFVLPHAGVRIGLAPNDLLVFDPAMAHGLCRPQDQGVAQPASFEQGGPHRQVFLTGELPLPDDRWNALGSPWLPVQAPARQGALDLMVATFDDRTGTIQRPHALLGAMRPDARLAGDLPT